MNWNPALGHYIGRTKGPQKPNSKLTMRAEQCAERWGGEGGGRGNQYSQWSPG
jgi:hypothetical protein